MGRDAASELLPGTLALPILNTFGSVEMRGDAVAPSVRTLAGDVFTVGSSLAIRTVPSVT
jgi:hypothetical protein